MGHIRYFIVGEYMVEYANRTGCFRRREYGNQVFNETQAGWEDRPGGDAVHGVSNRAANGPKRGRDAIQVSKARGIGDTLGGGVR